jgi:hypothetical protein
MHADDWDADMARGAVRVDDQSVCATAEALADGFHDDEIWTWLLPGRLQLRRVLPRYYEAMIRRVFAPREAAWTTADAAGGALWFPPGTGELSRREQLRTGFTLLPEGAGSLRKGARWERLIHDNLPHEPHWRLNSLAVNLRAAPGHRQHADRARSAPGEGRWRRLLFGDPAPR